MKKRNTKSGGQMLTGEDLTAFLNATGKIEYGMTVDYMFRVVLQRSKPALTGLTASILHLRKEDITDIFILNPINPGENIVDKEIRMDVRVSLNNNTTLDLEMQVKNEGDWPERSVTYLCREFDSISSGEEYETVKSVYQIGFLDFTLFKDHHEFCGRYQLRNQNDNHLYTDKLNLIVVSLNQTNLATDEDKTYEIDKWAKFFKAKTWEDLKMIAQNNESMTSAAESIFLSNQDYNIRKVIRERQEHERYVHRLETENASLKKESKADKAKIGITQTKLDEALKTIAKLEAELKKYQEQDEKD